MLDSYLVVSASEPLAGVGVEEVGGAGAGRQLDRAALGDARQPGRLHDAGHGGAGTVDGDDGAGSEVLDQRHPGGGAVIAGRDQVVGPDMRTDDIAEHAVDALIAALEIALELGQPQAIVEQRPQGAIGVAVVIFFDVLFGQAYFLRFDAKLWEAQQPYAPLGTLYAAAVARQCGWNVALFDAMLAGSVREWEAALDRHLESQKPFGVPLTVTIKVVDRSGVAQAGRAVYLWQDNFDAQVIEQEKPDVVLHEIVGRHLHTIGAYPELVPEP